ATAQHIEVARPPGLRQPLYQAVALWRRLARDERQLWGPGRVKTPTASPIEQHKVPCSSMRESFWSPIWGVQSQYYCAKRDPFWVLTVPCHPGQFDRVCADGRLRRSPAATRAINECEELPEGV